MIRSFALSLGSDAEQSYIFKSSSSSRVQVGACLRSRLQVCIAARVSSTFRRPDFIQAYFTDSYSSLARIAWLLGESWILNFCLGIFAATLKNGAVVSQLWVTYLLYTIFLQCSGIFLTFHDLKCRTLAISVAQKWLRSCWACSEKLSALAKSKYSFDWFQCAA